MLTSRSASRKIAATSVFAVVYAIARLIPITPYVGIASFLTFGEAISPLAGMLLGPLVGGGAVVLGTFLDFTLGRPVVFDGLDFLPGLSSAITAGLLFSGRKKAGLAFPIALMLLFTLDPLSAILVPVGAFYVPFLSMHLLAVIIMGVVLVALGRGMLSSSSWIFVASTVFLSTMSAHVMGGIVYENVLVRVNATLAPAALQPLWAFFFYRYLAERPFFTVAGTLIAIPVLRALARRPVR